MKSLPKNKEDAIKSKSIFFFTGTPCLNGHISERYTVGGGCVECVKIKAEAQRRERKACAIKRKKDKKLYRNYYVTVTPESPQKWFSPLVQLQKIYTKLKTSL